VDVDVDVCLLFLKDIVMFNEDSTAVDVVE
jgi:hypothetical protein